MLNGLALGGRVNDFADDIARRTATSTPTACMSDLSRQTFKGHRL